MAIRLNLRRGRRGRPPENEDAPKQENGQSPDERDNLEGVPVQWRRLVGYLSPYKARLLVAVISLVFSAGISLVFPAVIGTVIDTIFNGGTNDQSAMLLNQITLALLAIFLLRSLTTMLESYNLAYIGERIVVDVRQQLFRHLQTLPLGFFVSRRVGELVSRISNDVTVMRTVLTNNVNTLLQQTLIMIGSLVLMVIINWRLTLFIAALIPIIVGLGFGVGFYLRRISTRVQDQIADATTVTEETMQGIKEVKSFVREPYEVNRYETAIGNAFWSSIQLARLNAVFGGVMAFLAFGSLAGFLWFGGQEVISGRLDVGELITFLFYGVSVAGSFASLVGLYTQFQAALGATRRVFQILDTTAEVSDKPGARELDHVDGRVTFDNVGFSYDGDNEVLTDINLDVKAGEIVALVGPSGAGKSTMFNLIPRFYDVSDGTLKIDSHDVRDVTQASLRNQIGIVPQETLLFGGTIRENLLYGRLDATEEEMFEAARAANAHDFIMELPDKYETVVGERGMRLSGGQRQRVAIARAILKDPRILLLDEATSSLDNESEHLVQEALGRLMQNRTTVIIAHRLSTIRVADRIAVLDRGQIVELGTHEELMQHDGGLYAKLYEMQFREQDLSLIRGNGSNGTTAAEPVGD